MTLRCGSALLRTSHSLTARSGAPSRLSRPCAGWYAEKPSSARRRTRRAQTRDALTLSTSSRMGGCALSRCSLQPSKHYSFTFFHFLLGQGLEDKTRRLAAAMPHSLFGDQAMPSRRLLTSGGLSRLAVARVCRGGATTEACLPRLEKARVAREQHATAAARSAREEAAAREQRKEARAGVPRTRDL